MTSTLNKKDLYKKIPGMLKIAAIFGVVSKIPNFHKYIKDLLVNRVDVAAEILLKLKVKPEELRTEMFGDIKEIAVGYITQGKIAEMVELKNLLRLTPENLKEILILAIKEQTLNPNFTNIKSFIDKKDFAFNSAVLKEDLRLKEIVQATMNDLKNMTFSPNGKDLKNEAKKLGELFGIKTEVPAGEKKDPFKFDGGLGSNKFDYPKFDDLDDDFDFDKN
jgi:hypothetical protein